ncbi:MAG: sigma factor [Gordonia sp. (in: high G+C Gram-positive bacteria)]|uniref:sigma factor n=1 Tax=Gordonia sp. (in: high G+C Gram-positive bacteria) TaxID=84139 RepID=UPI0039E57749
MDRAAEFEDQRPRLTRLATRILADPVEAQDVVQQAWLRLDGSPAQVDNLPAWLTTVTSRLCLDRLKARIPVPAEPDDGPTPDAGPADAAVLGDEVGDALGLVLDRLTPPERIAFVMHDSFDFDFPTIAAALDVAPATARKLASRGRAKVRNADAVGAMADREVVDAFMAAARGGEFDRLIAVLAPDARVRADDAAIATGTPERLDGSRAIAGFFNGSAHAALPAILDGRPVYAWFLRGEPMVVFDFDVTGGTVGAITFRADPAVLSRVTRRPARSS